MKIKKYDIFGNPINDISSDPTNPKDEIDPFLESMFTEAERVRREEKRGEYNARLEVNKERVKERVKAYNSDPVNKERVKERVKAYRDDPVNKAKAKEYRDNPVNKAKAKEWREAYNELRRNNEGDHEIALREAKEVLEDFNPPGYTSNKASSVIDKASSVIGKLAKKVPKSKLALAALTSGASLAVEAADQLFDAEHSGAREDMPEYWMEKGSSPEETRAKVFKLGLTTGKGYNKIPGAYERDDIKKYKEDVLAAEAEGSLRDNYVEDVQEPSDYSKFNALRKKLR